MTTLANDPKLSASRLARRAIVYVRQSTPKQVEHNRESRELQYALVDRARAPGWKRVDVIDDDLGASAGLAAMPREGFERLLAAVALGEVGVIMSREASRLSLVSPSRDLSDIRDAYRRRRGPLRPRAVG